MATLRAIEIFNDSRHTLIAVESVDFIRRQSATSYLSYGYVEPIAVVVCCSDGVYALNMTAEFAKLDPLRRDTPGLNAMIASFNSRHSGSV